MERVNRGKVETRRLRSEVELEQWRNKILSERKPERTSISICGGTGCRAYRTENVADALAREIEQQGLTGQVELKVTGCHGLCERGPLVVVYPQKIFYQRVTPYDAPEIIAETAKNGRVLDRLLYVDPVSQKKLNFEHEVPFYAKQYRLVFGSNGIIDPTSIEDYIATGGYLALVKAFNMSPEEIIEEVRKAGLRGRGGAGFPTARKWETCRNAPLSDGIRYVICNADEGDPGAYANRSLLEGNPHSVVEGMIIGAYAIGSHYGYVYVRHEYPLAVANLGVALNQARECGLLGEDILGSGFDFNIKISRGGGAFICGESTALMASLEG